MAEAGDTLFLTKDSTLSPEAFAQAFDPATLVRFRTLKAQRDPDELLQTDVYRRLLRPAMEIAAGPMPTSNSGALASPSPLSRL